MCFTGQCRYENIEGECTAKTYKGLIGQTVYPNDARCVIYDPQCIEELNKTPISEEIEEEDPDDWNMDWGYVTGGYYGEFEEDTI